jgi:predicted  nucleic acid-binding Zn-ribbon protein
MTQPFKLFRLQQIDSQLDQMKTRLKENEATLNDTAALDQVKQDVALTEESYQTIQKALRRAEENVQAQKNKIEQTEDSLYSGKIRNPKELQDLQNESISLKKHLEQLEDRQLEAMISLEETGQIYQRALEKLKQIRTTYEQLTIQLLTEQTNLNKEIERLEIERQSATGGILENDLSLYESLRIQRKGIAVSSVTDKSCSACGSTLNAALLQSARSLNQMARCDSCGRILYGG